MLYIAMLLVEGGDLSSLLRQRGAMHPDVAVPTVAANRHVITGSAV